MISLCLLDSLSKIVLADYPRIDSIVEYDNIRNEFVGLSDEDINKNLCIIDSFYTSFITYDFIKKVAGFPVTSSKTNLKSIRSFQYDDYGGTGLNQNEFWVMANNPRLINGVQRATKNSFSYTDVYFPKASWGQYQDKADAFRHAIWNAFLAKEAGPYRNWSYQCNEFAQEFTNAHESGSSKPANLTDDEWYLDTEMDYHNNAFGRIYFYAASWSHKACWVCNRFVKSPPESEMAQTIYNTYIPGAIFVSSKQQIDAYPSNLVYLK